MCRVVAVGIEGFDPDLVKNWIDDLPNFKGMQQRGAYGRLESTVPPMHFPAWISSQCGRNPGAFGIWEDSYRDDFSYCDWHSLDSGVVDERVDCLYKILPGIAQRVALIDAPGSWPPHDIPGGYCVSSSAGSSGKDQYTRPVELRDEIADVVKDYNFDPSVGQWDPDNAVDAVRGIDAQRCSLVRYFTDKKQCDYVFSLLSGLHLLSQTFCRHPGATDGKAFMEAVHDYYHSLDAMIGKLIEGLEDALILLYSAYGVQESMCSIHLNEWLVKEGLLSLVEYPAGPEPLCRLRVDWSNTRCWCHGDNGGLFINLEGRESQGIVERAACDDLLDELTRRIGEIKDDKGEILKIETERRDDIHFGSHAEYGPDLFVSIERSGPGYDDAVGHGKGNILSSGIRSLSRSKSGYFCCIGTDVPAKGEVEGTSRRP
jgi:predicted AlkP superfamily phosphohydrolase/phosphomutase